MKLCKCGAEVEDHVRFHWTGDTGHYVGAPAGDKDESSEDGPETWPPNLRRMSAQGFMGDPPKRAPHPGLVPDQLTWLPEESLRRMALEFLEGRGYEVHDLEQGFRPDGSSRVSLGLPDAYVQGHGVRAWLEFKRWDNELTADQKTFAAKELRNGGSYLLIYEVEQVRLWHVAVKAGGG